LTARIPLLPIAPTMSRYFNARDAFLSSHLQAFRLTKEGNIDKIQ
jgi:hypothetical protein